MLLSLGQGRISSFATRVSAPEQPAPGGFAAEGYLLPS